MPVTVVSGDGRAHEFVRLANEALTAALPFSPYPGTLNLDGYPERDHLPTDRMTDVGDDYCDGVDLFHCRVNGVLGAVIEPDVPGYPLDKTEVLAPIHLRTLFDLQDGDSVRVTAPNAVDHAADDVRFVPDALDDFEGVVFDLDGTLVDLAVDWGAVRRDLTALLEPYLTKPVDAYGPGALHELAVTAGERDAYRDCLAVHECDAVGESTALPLLSVLSELDCPVGVCTLNAVEAAIGVLERFDVASAVDVIVGRETTDTAKPDPEPLQVAVSELGVDEGEAVFVGDDVRDATTAESAGTSYLHPEWTRFD